MSKILKIIVFILCPLVLNAQYFLELHTDYDDTFREWELILEQDSSEVEGELELSWGLNNDFTQWQYRIEEKYGEIQQKFQNNPGFWELRSEGKTVTIRQVWPGDVREWKISHDGRSFKMLTSHPNRLDEWYMDKKEYGELIVYTEMNGDPRDWIIEDYMMDDITFEERMAAIFIAVFSSVPKL